MKIDKIEFVCSSPSLKFCPKEDLPEFAFIGRSNVGKSSLINMLAGQKGLAKVSNTPGKTRLLNHFKVGSSIAREPGSGNRTGGTASWFLVDLPGYGFAKLSKTQREKFEGLIHTYLQNRENLALTFLLIDSRLEPQKIDLEFMNWLGDNEVGFVILFTKTDKLSKTQQSTNLAAYQKALSAHWDELPAIILTSSETKSGREEVLATIGEALLQIEKAG
ncbi:MAG: ribosome biogenesis GTP-binding protein YihA/YsxC [Bacteroidetes bacterium]|nr:ribosome biogenesis GTP-binding protein YihA/YsxC [Bacteroidota bacterium]